MARENRGVVTLPGNHARGWGTTTDGWKFYSPNKGKVVKRRGCGEGECDWCGRKVGETFDYRKPGWLDWVKPRWVGAKWCGLRCWEQHWGLGELPGSRGRRTAPKMRGGE